MAISERESGQLVRLEDAAGSGGFDERGAWVNPGWLRHDFMRAHDGSLADRPDGRWLSPQEVVSQTLKLARAYLGETPRGKQVFVVAPTELRSRRLGREAEVPLSNMQALEWAQRYTHLRAVASFYQAGMLSRDEATRQAGGMDPWEGVDRLQVERREFKDQLARWRVAQNKAAGVPLRTSGSDSVLGAVGTVIGLTLMAESAKQPKKDDQGRQYRQLREVVYWGSTAVTVGSLLVSACTPQPQPAVVETGPNLVSPSLTLETAQQALQPWVGVEIGGEAKAKIEPPVVLIGQEVDPTRLLTLSPMRQDESVEASIQWGMGKVQLRSSRDGSASVMPMMVEYD